MEAAIQTVVKVFIKSSKGKENLGQKDFQNLVKSQLGNILSGADSKEAVKNMSQGLDSNNDGRVGFEEYMKLVGYLACSLSEQRNLENEEPEQNAATAQAAQSAPNNTGGQPKENAEEETKPEPKQEAKADVKVEVKAEAKAEGETKPDAVKVEAAVKAEAPAVVAPVVVAPAVVAPAVVAAAEVKVAEKEPEKVEKTEKVDEAVEKSAASPEEEAAKKTEEATS